MLRPIFILMIIKIFLICFVSMSLSIIYQYQHFQMKRLYHAEFERIILFLEHLLLLLQLTRQSSPTRCDPREGSPPGSSVPGILQARMLEWVAISFSDACMHAKLPQLCLTLGDPMDSSPPGSSICRILQARRLEWAAISFSILNI